MSTHTQLPQEINEVLPSKATGCFTEDKLILKANGYSEYITRLKVGDAVIEPCTKVAYIRSLYYEVLRAFKVTPERGKPYFVNAEHMLPVIHQKEKTKKLVSVWNWYNMSPKEQAGWRLYKAGVPYYRSGVTPNPNIDPYTQGFKKWGLQFPDIPGSGLITSHAVPYLYHASSVKNRLEFLAGLMDAKGIRTPKGYLFDVYYDPLAQTILKLCWSLGIEAIDDFSVMGTTSGDVEIGLHHIKITEGNLLIPSRKYQTKGVPENAEDLVSLCHSLCKFMIEDTGEYMEFYGICTDGSGYYLTGDFTCAYHCEPTEEDKKEAE